MCSSDLIWFQTVITVLTCLILIPFANSFSGKIIKEEGYGMLFVFSSLNLLFTILPYTIIGLYRLQRKAFATVTFTVLSSLLTIVLNITFVVILKKGLNGIFFSTMLSSLIQTIFCFFSMREWLSISWWDSELFKKMFRFALPLIPTSFAYWITNSSATYFINHFLTKSEVGLFQIASSLASVMLMITGSFQMAWGPFAYSIKSDEDSKSVYAKVLMLYSILTGILIIGFCTFAKPALLIFTTPVYASSFIAASILAMSFIVIGYGYIASIGLNLAKTNTAIAASIFIASAITITGFYFLIPVWGIEGAAVSILAGQLAVPVYSFARAQKRYFIPYDFKTTSLLFITTLLFCALVIYISANYRYGIVINCLILFFFIAAVFFAYRKSAFLLLSKLRQR